MDSLVSPPGAARNKPNTTARSNGANGIARAACGIRGENPKRAVRDAGLIPAFAVTTLVCAFPFAQAAVGDGILPASPPPFLFWAVQVFKLRLVASAERAWRLRHSRK